MDKENEGVSTVETYEVPTIESLEQEIRRERYKKTFWQVLRSTLFYLVVVAAAAVLIVVLLLPILQISGTSMTETLNDGDIVIATHSSDLQTGDVIAFYYNNAILIKRVIATAGDWVDIDGEGNVFVNGEMLNEPYISEKDFGECNIKLPFQVPDARYFVLGDHRRTSIDSRNTAVGCVSDDMIVGKIILRVWPFSGLGLIQ